MRRWRQYLAAALAVVLIGNVYLQSTVKAKDTESIDTTAAEPPKTTEEEEAATQKAYEMTVSSNQWDEWPQGPQTYGEAAIVMEAGSGAVLYAKNIDGKAYPASITKILTVLVALENADLEDKVTVTDNAVGCLLYGYAHIGLKPGEELSLRDSLYAVLLASANEAAYAVAESVGEGYDWFIKQMNTRVKELGGKNSNFVNTNGMEDDNHYTTARDMALITRELLVNHPEFAEISQTLQYTIPATNLESETRTFQQKHQMFYEANDYYNPNVIAGKTGYTDLALNTLVTCAEKEGTQLVCVVLKTHGRNVYTDTQALLDYGFDNFEKVSINENEKSKDIESVEDGAYVMLPAGVKFDDLKMQITEDETDKHKGVISYFYEENPVGSAEVTFSKSYLRKDTPEITVKEKKASKTRKDTSLLKKIIIGILIIFAVMVLLMVLVLILAYIRKIQRRKRRRRRKIQRQKQMQRQRKRQKKVENKRNP